MNTVNMTSFERSIKHCHDWTQSTQETTCPSILQSKLSREDLVNIARLILLSLRLSPELAKLIVDFCLSSCQEGEDDTSQDDCLKVGSAYVIVYSVTDRSSFDAAAELRITLRRIRQAENLPIILVGNKSDLVRSREVAVEGGCQRSKGYHTYTYLYGTSYQRLTDAVFIIYPLSCVFFSQRAERVQWCLTVSSLRRRRLCNIT